MMRRIRRCVCWSAQRRRRRARGLERRRVVVEGAGLAVGDHARHQCCRQPRDDCMSAMKLRDLQHIEPDQVGRAPGVAGRAIRVRRQTRLRCVAGDPENGLGVGAAAELEQRGRGMAGIELDGGEQRVHTRHGAHQWRDFNFGGAPGLPLRRRLRCGTREQPRERSVDIDETTRLVLAQQRHRIGGPVDADRGVQNDEQRGVQRLVGSQLGRHTGVQQHLAGGVAGAVESRRCRRRPPRRRVVVTGELRPRD